MTTTTETAELDPANAEIVTATLPLIGANIDAITTAFYRRLFENHPQLLRNLFNRGNQAQGAQQRALAASIATFATHLVDPALPHPVELLSRIGHKHASLGIVAEQYPVVHDNLFAAIVEVLGADTVTAEVAAAWDQVFWIMAGALIDLERALYAGAGVRDGDVYRRAQVLSRVDDPSGAVEVTVAPLAAGTLSFAPGQYVSVGVTLPDGARQLRQYSLINVSSSSGELTFAVKPAGEVSTWIRDNLRVGDLLDVTVPFGDLPTPTPGAPLVLISAGVGITPMIGILEAVEPATRVVVLHADRSGQTHPLRDRQRELVAALPDATLDVWYEEGAQGSAGEHVGFLRLDEVDLPAGAEVYLCGADGFVRAVRDQLISRGVQRVHCELFSPNDWLLS
ncbi:MAG: globin domain-containing protein [Mycobacterium sp.]